MPRQRTLEFIVGLFIIAGVCALLALALKVSGLTTYTGGKGYTLTASFENVGGLKPLSPVTIAGVQVGRVTAINFDAKTFNAVVTLNLNKNLQSVPSDTSAQILTQGLLGSNYIGLTPGYSETPLKNGDKIAETHSALILENLIGQLLYKITGDKKEEKGKDEKK
ncbi:outer membrane lipid asymmetry maintenance protein MlaD [soil metagenome]